jgi:hypothetical protein
MDKTHCCPGCGSSHFREYAALLAPFIAKWANIHPAPKVCDVARCDRCDLIYFRQRYSGDEMNRLYASYRSPAYLSARRKHEPWYTQKMNGANLRLSVVMNRRNGLMAYLRPFLSLLPGDCAMVDVGGDAGQFIPQELGFSNYVIEVSDRQVVPGVTRLVSPDRLPRHERLLVVVSHVLEHLPDPAGFLRENLDILASRCRECYVYLEVPFERFNISPMAAASWYRRYLMFCQVMALWPFFLALDFASLAVRGLLGWIGPPFFLKLHEHINFFDRLSLEALAERSGISVQSVQIDRTSSLLTQQGVIRLFGQVPSVSSSLLSIKGPVD